MGLRVSRVACWLPLAVLALVAACGGRELGGPEPIDAAGVDVDVDAIALSDATTAVDAAASTDATTGVDDAADGVALDALELPDTPATDVGAEAGSPDASTDATDATGTAPDAANTSDAADSMDAGAPDGQAIGDGAIADAGDPPDGWPVVVCEGGQPPEVCIEYFAALSTCSGEDEMDQACALTFDAGNVAQLEALCALNLQRLQQSCF